MSIEQETNAAIEATTLLTDTPTPPTPEVAISEDATTAAVLANDVPGAPADQGGPELVLGAPDTQVVTDANASTWRFLTKDDLPNGGLLVASGAYMRPEEFEGHEPIYTAKDGTKLYAFEVNHKGNLTTHVALGLATEIEFGAPERYLKEYNDSLPAMADNPVRSEAPPLPEAFHTFKDGVRLFLRDKAMVLIDTRDQVLDVYAVKARGAQYQQELADAGKGPIFTITQAPQVNVTVTPAPAAPIVPAGPTATRGPRPLINLLNASPDQKRYLLSFVTPSFALSVWRRIQQGRGAHYAALDFPHYVQGHEGFFYDSHGLALQYDEIYRAASDRILSLKDANDSPAVVTKLTVSIPSEGAPGNHESFEFDVSSVAQDSTLQAEGVTKVDMKGELIFTPQPTTTLGEVSKALAILLERDYIVHVGFHLHGSIFNLRCSGLDADELVVNRIVNRMGDNLDLESDEDAKKIVQLFKTSFVVSAAAAYKEELEEPKPLFKESPAIGFDLASEEQPSQDVAVSVEAKVEPKPPAKPKYALAIPAWQRFMPRDQWQTAMLDRHGPTDHCEKNPNFLQILPYILIEDDRNCIFSYKRGNQGTETRLHDLRSVGLGGHIDTPGSDKLPIDDVIVDEAIREVEEEVGYKVPRDQMVAALKDSFILYVPENEVDKVHLAIVLRIKVSSPRDLQKLEEGNIEDPKWMSREYLDQYFAAASFLKPEALAFKFETWSRVALQVTRIPEITQQYKRSIGAINWEFQRLRILMDMYATEVDRLNHPASLPQLRLRSDNQPYLEVLQDNENWAPVHLPITTLVDKVHIEMKFEGDKIVPKKILIISNVASTGASTTDFLTWKDMLVLAGEDLDREAQKRSGLDTQAWLALDVEEKAKHTRYTAKIFNVAFQDSGLTREEWDALEDKSTYLVDASNKVTSPWVAKTDGSNIS